MHVTEDRDNKWKVDHIVDSCLKNKKLEYLIHWKSYDNLDYIWASKSNLGNMKAALQDFHHSCPSAQQALYIDPVDFLLLLQKQPELFTEGHSYCLHFYCL